MKPIAFKRRVRSWGRRQLYSLFSSLGSLLSHRVGTLMTVLVLGIAMVLPVGLLLTLENLRGIDLQEDQWGSLTVFLEMGVSEGEVLALEQTILQQGVARTSLVSPQQGLDEFRQASGFGNALDVLDSKPLRWIIEVEPQWSELQTMDAQAASLTEWLQEQEQVENVVVDSKWLQRLASLIRLGNAFVSVLGMMF